jgi:hypothetical protein
MDMRLLPSNDLLASPKGQGRCQGEKPRRISLPPDWRWEVKEEVERWGERGGGIVGVLTTKYL